MDITNIFTPITIDISKPNVNSLVYAKQYDRGTRNVRITVLNNENPYILPTNGVKYVVRVMKPDGKTIAYEEDENETSAVSISSNIATVILSQQALSSTGLCRIEICIQNTSGTEILTSFSFRLNVEACAIDN